jgi:two-component system, cell cycle sensor histidine kinase and response regulator CckA
MTKAENKYLLQVARKVAATIGTDFFRAMAKHLAGALAADCVIIGEFVGGREEQCRTVAAWLDDAPAEFAYPLAGSATSGVVLGKPAVCRSDAQTQFPSDSLLKSVEAQAYIGLPLTNAAHHPIGVLMALFRQPATSLRTPKALLEIFAARASSELARKQEEEKLRESQERYRAFIAQNPDAMWRVEFPSPIPIDLPEQEQFDRIYATGYIAECNDAAARRLGFEKAQQLIGRGMDQIAPASDTCFRQAVLVGIRSAYQLTNAEACIVDIHGDRRYILRSQWGIVEDGKLERIWGCGHDITDVKQAEKALDASEQRMTDMLEAMHLLVVILDPGGAVAFCNRYFYRLTGWRPRDLLGKEWLDKMIPKDEHSRVQSEFARGKPNPETPIHFESSLLTPDGRRRQLAWDGAVLRGSDGETAGHALIGKDITEFKALEEQFRQSQKLAAIGRLAGGVAHDFNNLLTIILGYASALLEKLKPSDLAYIGLSEIRKAAEKGADLSRGLLTFSRRQALRPRVINLNSLVEDTGQMLAILIGADIQLKTNLERKAGYVRLDTAYFHHALLNLAINARDAMPRGGSLTITTSHVEVTASQSQTNAIPPGNYVRLTVADNGAGMSKEVREHLFEPFFTTKEMGKGTGLGLSTVYGIVKQSGGYILVESEVAQGTAFHIYLPRLEEEPAPAEATNHKAMPRGAETILLVEDRDDVRTLAATVLKDLGYNVLDAGGPARAIELNRRQAGAIHLLLADAGSVDSLVNLVKTSRPHIKVLLISGCGESEMPIPPSAKGFGYLQKPFTPLDLAVKVREILDRG